MSDILSRIVGPVAVASGTSTLFTGTAAHTYSIKSIRIVNTDASNAKTITLGIGGVAAGNQILPAITIDAGGWAEWDGLISMSGTETLQANASATGLTITVSGLDQS
jgi:hypothetical protein